MDMLEAEAEAEAEAAMMDRIDRETDKELNERSKRESLSEFESSLYLDGTACDKLILQLSLYRYIADIAEIHVGKYIRWINKTEIERDREREINNGKRKSSVLTIGGVVTRVHKLQEWFIFVYNKYTRSNIQIRYKDVLVYQKLTDMEQLILAIRSQK